MQQENNNANNIKKQHLNEHGIPVGASAGQVMKDFNELKFKHYSYGIVSFLMSAFFYFDWLSPDWWDKTIEGGFDFLITQAGVFGIMGWAFAGVITLLIMHSHTTSNKTFKFAGYSLVPVVILLGMSFNVFTETASTAEKVQDRVTVKSEQSASYKSAVIALNKSGGSITESKHFQELSKHLGENKAYLAEAIQTGNQRRIDKWQKLVDKRSNELRELKQTWKDEAQASMEAKRQNLETASNNASYAQVVVRWVQDQFELSFVFAAILISFLIILVYEVLGVLVGDDYRTYKTALPFYFPELGAELEAKASMKAVKARVNAQAENMKHEQKERELELRQYQQERQAEQLAEQVREKYKLAGDPVTSPSAGSAKVSADDNNNRPTPDAELAKLRAEIDRLKAQNSSEKAATLDRQNDLALNNPKQDKASSKASLKQDSENGYTEPLKQDSCTSAKSKMLKQDSKQERVGFSDTGLLYPQWKKAVLKQECKLTQRPIVSWVKKELGLHTSKQVKDVTDKYAAVIMELLYKRGLHDGIIKINPKWRKAGSIPKYILA